MSFLDHVPVQSQSCLVTELKSQICLALVSHSVVGQGLTVPNNLRHVRLALWSVNTKRFIPKVEAIGCAEVVVDVLAFGVRV